MARFSGRGGTAAGHRGDFPLSQSGRDAQGFGTVQDMNDNALRFAGLTSMLIGVILLYLIN